MTFPSIQTYAKSLPGSQLTSGTGSSNIKTQVLIPAPQLMIQIINLAQKFEKSKLSHIGFFHYIKNYFNKKHPSSYDSKMGIFLNSVVKYGKDGSQLNFFAHLIESDTEYLIISALVKAIDLMKKKYQELNGRSDDSFKKVKMNIQDILKILKRIFQKKIDNYVDLNGTNLQVRVRDYVIEIQPTVIMETSGLGFLEIVRREAVLVKQHLEKELALSANTEDLFREKPEDDHDLQKMQENFYNINDFMGHQYHHLPDGYVKGVKKYQMFQRMGDERVDPKLREGGANYEPENKGAVEDIEELSFDDIYETIHDKQMDRDFLDLIKNVQKMENKSKDLDNDLKELPVFQAYVDELNQQILAKLKDRYEKMQFMKAMMMKVTNHFENAGEQMTPGDQDTNQDVETEEHFYMHFHKDLAGKLFGVKKIERHIITEYYKSSNKSQFQRIGGIYDYDNPKTSPGAGKKGKNKSNDEDFDYNYEDDEDFQEFGRTKDSRQSRNQKGSVERNQKKPKAREDSSDEHEDDPEVDDDYLETVKDNIRRNTSSKQKEILKNRRLKNEQNISGRGQKVGSRAKNTRSDSEEEESESNYQDNLGRLADYVKSSEYHKRKDLETGNASSDEEGEVVFKNTKQKGGNKGAGNSGGGIEYSKIKRTAQSSESEQEDQSDNQDQEYDNSYDRYSNLKDSNSQSLSNSKVSPKKSNGRNGGDSKIKIQDKHYSSEEEDADDYQRNTDLLRKLKQSSGSGTSQSRAAKTTTRPKNNERRLPKLDPKPEKHKLADKRSFRENDLPAPIQGLDCSKYENLIYKSKKRTMYIAMKDFRPKDRNYFPMRQGDILCSVYELKGWRLVYVEENPKKFGFVPDNYLNVIH